MANAERMWPARVSLGVALLACAVVGVGWWNAPSSQYDIEPALALAVIGFLISVLGLLAAALSSLVSMRRFGTMMMLTVAALVASAGLDDWVSVQPYGD